nr:putative exocyst complex component sec8 [Quercus suber]
MSYMRNQANGTPSYMINSNRLQRFDVDTTPDTSADERSQSREVTRGGFGRVKPSAQDQTHGPSRMDKQRAHRRSRDRDDYSDGPSTSQPGVRYGTSGSQVEDQQWSLMASDTCIPIKVALQLMDSSSLGLADQYDTFQDTHLQLQNALKVIVNEHHQGFNSSIGTFHKIQAAIQTSQQRVRVLRAGLVQAKANLATTKPELSAFATSSQSYDYMLQIIAQIEQLQQVPEQLEMQISEKRFLSAVSTLQEALTSIRKPELEDIGALSNLKVYLSNQEHSLADILIEELHSHLYLKSPYCEERWKAHMKHTPAENGSGILDDYERAMHRFLDSYDGTKPMEEDTAKNPEADTFYYIQLLVESLSRMSQMEALVDSIEQRLPVELFRVVERSYGEVEQRHPNIARSTASTKNGLAMSMAAVGSHQGPDDEQKSTLEDLLNTLYAKFEAIAEGHRVLHDVTAGVLKRDPDSDIMTLNRSFRELWKLFQSEIRSLLHDHLATNGDLSAHRSRGNNDPSGNIFRPFPRDRNRKLFHLSETDSQSSELVTEREDLEFIFKASVPGLVNTQQSQMRKKDRDINALPDRSATGHKLLVQPSVFNMAVLLPSSLSFLGRLKDIVPPHSSVVARTLTSFLDDFLLNVFYPQLEETLLEICGHSMNDMEAFQSDPVSTQKYSSRPVFKGTIRFYELMEAVCSMLDDLPHEQSFSQLVITQMRSYYDKCYQWSKSLLQRTVAAPDGQVRTKMRLAADLATSGGVNDVVVAMLDARIDESEKLRLAEKQSALLISLVKTRRPEEADIIQDRKAIGALCTLHVSMKWLAARCSQLRYVSPRAVDMSNMQAHHNRRWTTTSSSAPTSSYLPLDAQTATQFDAVLFSFTELSTLTLRTLQIDIRLHLLHGIYAAMDTTYELSQPYNDPDPAVLAIFTALSSYDAQIRTHLLPPQYSILTSNLHILVNNALVSLVSAIPAMDSYGNARMQLNVVVLQQSLKNVQNDASLDKAARYYELAGQGAQAILKEKNNTIYEKGDLKALMRLCWDQARDGRLESVDEMVARLD